MSPKSSPLNLETILVAKLTHLSGTLDHFSNYYYSEIFPETNLNDARYLLVLGERGEASAVDIVKAMNFDKTTASRNIKRLISQGLIERKPDLNDARKSSLTLSKEGKRIYNEISQSVQLRNKAAISSLSKGELSILFEILEKLQDDADKRLTTLAKEGSDPSIDYKKMKITI